MAPSLPAKNVGNPSRLLIQQFLSERKHVYLTLYEPTDDRDELERRAIELGRIMTMDLPAGREVPSKTASIVESFARDPAVKAWVRKAAAGICEACMQPAPFEDENGRPFREIHHIKRLANGGSDKPSNALAICPNCHRRLHHGADRDVLIERMFLNIKRLERE